MADRFNNMKPTLESKTSGSAFAVTPNDTTDFAQSTKQIYIGGAGNLKVKMSGYYSSSANTASGNSVITFTGLNAGTTLDIRVSRIYSTGTTATNLVGLF